MRYLKEEYRWDTDNKVNYYHLANSKIIEDAPEKEEYWEDGSLFIISKLEENEVQTTRRRKSK